MLYLGNLRETSFTVNDAFSSKEERRESVRGSGEEGHVSGGTTLIRR